MFHLTIFFITERGHQSRDRSVLNILVRFLKYIFRHKSAGFCCFFFLQIFTLYYPWVIIIPVSKQKQTKTEPEV